MIVNHADNGTGGPLCQTQRPDSSGHIWTVKHWENTDCGWCLDALGFHRCGVSDLRPGCVGCETIAGVGRIGA